MILVLRCINEPLFPTWLESNSLSYVMDDVTLIFAWVPLAPAEREVILIVVQGKHPLLFL